jgi:signal transduction histidine kinase
MRRGPRPSARLWMYLVWLVLGTPCIRGPLLFSETGSGPEELSRRDVGAAFAAATDALDRELPATDAAGLVETWKRFDTWWRLARMRTEWEAMDATLAAWPSRLPPAGEADAPEWALWPAYLAALRAERAGDLRAAVLQLEDLEARHGESLPPAVRGTLLETLGRLRLVTAEFAAGTDHLLEAARLYASLPSRRAVARVWIALSGSSTQAARHRLAGPLEAREVFLEEGDEASLAYAYLVSGYEAFAQPAEAENAFREALRLAELTGNREAGLHARLGLAEVLLFADRAAESGRLLEGLLAELRPSAPLPLRAAVLRVAGYAAAFSPERARWLEGQARLEEAAELCRRMGDAETLQFVRLCQGELFLRMEQPEAAEPILRQAVAWFAEHRSRFLREALALLELACLRQADFEGAHEALAAYLAVREEEFASGLEERMAELSARHLADLRQAELVQLRTAQALAQAQAAEQAARVARLEAEQARQRGRHLAITLGLVVTTVGGVICGGLYQRKRLAERRVRSLNRELEAEKEALQRKSRELGEQNLQLSEANDRLKELDEERKHLLGIVAHDMRNPLATMESSFELIEHELAEPRQVPREAIREILGVGWEGARFLRSLIDRIVEARRQEPFHERLRLRPIALRAVLQQVVTLNQLHATRKGITVYLEGESVPAVQADTQACREVFDNLLSNAIKFSPEGTQVRLVPRLAAEDRVEILVEDQGPGIPAPERGRLFRPFGRTSVQPTGGESSAGLGLATVKELVSAMRGRVWIEAAPGGGAVFVVSLPVAGAGVLALGGERRRDDAGKKDCPAPPSP